MIYLQNNGLIIRGMKESDICKFPKLFKDQGWNKPEEQFKKYYLEHEQGKRIVLVAEENGELAGYVNLLPYCAEGPFKGKKIPEIADFNVLIKYQGLGIGTNLMNIAENLAKEKFNVVSLGVGLHSGYGSAQRMYAKRGYIPDGSGVWYKEKQHGKYEPCVNDDGLILYMLKELK